MCGRAVWTSEPFYQLTPARLKHELAFDLWGGADDGQARFRSFGAWLFGYTDSVFMDSDVFPNVLGLVGSVIFVRDPQIPGPRGMQTD
jgi:hypothetical protein